MKIWLTCVLVLYGMVEIYQWMKQFSLPLPAFILAGAVLAIASNYDKYAGWSFQKPAIGTKSAQTTPNPETQPANSATALPKPTKPISFKIRTVETELLNDNKT
ncbi:MAG: hypothetical protein WA828_08900 [Coleofasciculaceae cyanobacterium]